MLWPLSTVRAALPDDEGREQHASSFPNQPQPPERERQRLSRLAFTPHRLKLYSGSSNAALAERVAQHLGKQSMDDIVLKRFADGERYVRLVNSVRGCNVFLVQSTCAPVNDNLLELLLMIDACRRAHAAQIIVVLPYYGYARADRIVDPHNKRREALTSKLVSNAICEAGADRAILVDIHSPQSCGFFDVPIDHVYASPVLVDHVNGARRCNRADDLVVVSPDAGGVARARAYAKALHDAPLAIIDKRRSGHNVAEVMNLVGEVAGKTAVVVDDMIDTAGTICAAARLLREKGAARVIALATHGIFSALAVERLSSGVFEEVVITDTVPLPASLRFPQLRVVSCAHLLGETIWRVHEETTQAS